MDVARRAFLALRRCAAALRCAPLVSVSVSVSVSVRTHRPGLSSADGQRLALQISCSRAPGPARLPLFAVALGVHDVALPPWTARAARAPDLAPPPPPARASSGSRARDRHVVRACVFPPRGVVALRPLPIRDRGRRRRRERGRRRRRARPSSWPWPSEYFGSFFRATHVSQIDDEANVPHESIPAERPVLFFCRVPEVGRTSFSLRRNTDRG